MHDDRPAPALISPASRVISALFAVLFTALTIPVLFQPPALSATPVDVIVPNCVPAVMTAIRPQA